MTRGQHTRIGDSSLYARNDEHTYMLWGQRAKEKTHASGGGSSLRKDDDNWHTRMLKKAARVKEKIHNDGGKWLRKLRDLRDSMRSIFPMTRISITSYNIPLA